MTRDKLLHITLGLLAGAVGYGCIVVHSVFGLGPMLAYVTTVTGIGYEVQQYVRKEGQVEALDALATAAPGWIAWALLA